MSSKDLMKETPLRYKVFLSGMEKPVNNQKYLQEVLTFIRNFAMPFQKKIISSLIRMHFYTISLIIFYLLFINRDFDYALICYQQ